MEIKQTRVITDSALRAKGAQVMEINSVSWKFASSDFLSIQSRIYVTVDSRDRESMRVSA